MAFDQEQYPYSPIPYQEQGGNDPLDRWLQIFNQQATQLVAQGKDPEKVQAALQQKQAALTAAYNYYGPSIFTPKPSGSELDASRNAYNLPTYTPQVEDSPLAEDRPTPPDFSNVKGGTIQDKNGIASPGFGDLMAEGNKTLTEAEKPIADTALGLSNFAMAGPIAGGITGLGELADTGDFKKAAEMATRVSDKLTYEPKTEGGKKILGAINKPFELWNDAGDWIGDKYYDLTGSPSVAAITSSVFKISPFLLGGGKLTKAEANAAFEKAPYTKGAKLSPDIPETPVPDPTRVDFTRQQDLFDTPEQNATEGSRDMFSGEMTPASTIEQRRILANDANTPGSAVPQRSPEQQAALESEYGFQQAERPQPQPPAEEPPAQAEMWNFGAEGNTQMAEAFRQAQLARGADLTGQNRFPRTAGEADASQGPQRNYPLNQAGQEELPLQGGQGDLFPSEAPQPTPKQEAPTTQETAAAPQGTPLEIPKTNALFSSEEKGIYPEDLGIKMHSDGTVSIPTQTSRVRTPEELAPITADNSQRALRQNAEDVVKSWPTAAHALQWISDKGGQLGALAKRVLDSNDLSKHKIEVVNPEDLTKTTDGLHHSLAPISGTVYGAQHGGRIALRGAGFIKNGMDKVTILHEVLHAALRDKIEGVLNGTIKDPKVVQAVHELDAIRQSLKDNYPDLLEDPTHPLVHALDNVHELTSVLMTDGKAQSALSGIKMGAVAALSKVKTVFAKILGTSRVDQPALDRIVELTNHVIDHNPNKAVQLDNSRTALLSQEKEAPIFERGLKGKDAVRAVESQKRGSELMGSGVALVNSRAGRTAAMKEGASNEAVTAYYEGKDPKALDKFPETKAAIDKDKNERNAPLSYGIAEEIRKIPNQSAKLMNMANAFVQHAGKHLVNIYKGSDYAKEAYDTAPIAEKLLAEGKSLNEKQTLSLGLVQGVRQWAREHIVPGTDLSKKTIDTLHDMSELVGVDAKNVTDLVERNSGLKGKDLKDAQRAALEDAIKKATHADELDRLVDQAVRMLGGFDKSGGRLGRYVEGARLGDIFTEKSHVPEPIAKYIGRVDDVFARIVATGEKQARGLAQLQAQGRLREALLGRGIWETAGKAKATTSVL